MYSNKCILGTVQYTFECKEMTMLKWFSIYVDKSLL